MAGSTLPHPRPTSSSSGWRPLITARYFSSGPSDSTSRRTPCPPGTARRWLQVRLGCVRLSSSCPFRLLHTFPSPRPARNYPHLWIQRSSFERRRDLNPPESRAAQRTIRLIHAPGFIGRLEVTAQPLLQLWRVALNPSPDRSVVGLQAAFIEELFDIAERERVPKIPAHAQ